MITGEQLQRADRQWPTMKAHACQVKQIFRANPNCSHPICSTIATYTFRLRLPDGSLTAQRYYACTAHKPPGGG